MAKIGSLSQALSSAQGQLSKNLNEIEQSLAKLGLGVWAWAKDDPLEVEEVPNLGADGNVGVVHRVRQLGYGEHEGRWCFLVASGTQEAWDDDATLSPLTESDFATQMLAVDRLPQLMDLFAEELIKLTQRVHSKVSAAQEIAAALGNR